MTISLLSIGTSMPSWVNQGFQEYGKRLHAPWNLNLVEVPAKKRTKTTSITAILKQESQQLWQIKPKGALNITLDRCGKSYNSQQLSQLLNNSLALGQHINFFIGGPEGLSAEINALADHNLSLSPLTFPHPLVRVILAEQLYRAWSIVHNRPYHR